MSRLTSIEASEPLDNHLRDTLSTQCLAVDECLLLDTGERIEDGGDEENNSSRDQRGSSCNDGEPLDEREDEVDGRAHVVGLKTAHEGVEAARSWADSQEEWDFDEEDEEGGNAT